MKDSLDKNPRITVRVGELLPQLRAECSRLNLRKSDVIRMALRGHFSAPDKFDSLIDAGNEMERLRRDLYRVGSNLNQVATALNTSDELQINELAQVHDDLRTSFKDIMTTLNKAISDATTSTR